MIKPCTPAEVAFYETANASHPALARYMPTFMGTLQLNASPEVAQVVPTKPQQPLDPVLEAAPESEGAVRIKGQKLSTDLAIVLENVAAGFKRPNILDVKLGARLWGDDAPPAKRTRLDEVAQQTTSGSLGFRIAGMRVWQGEPPAQGAKGRDAVQSEANNEQGSDYVSFDATTGYRVYNKLYGRRFTASDIDEGFREYLHVGSAGMSRDKAPMLAGLFAQHLRNIELLLAQEESRMYSASILFVYEGDAETMAATLKAMPQLAHDISEPNGPRVEPSDGLEDGIDGEDSDSENGEEEHPRIVAVKLIDFAHASFTPRQGPDENALKGVRSTRKIFLDLERES